MIDQVQKLLQEMKRQKDSAQKDRKILDDKISQEISSY
jgi:hypothetical protein